MNRGRMVFHRNRDEGTYNCLSLDDLVLYVCERVPGEGWLPVAYHRNPVTHKRVQQEDLAAGPVPLTEAKRRCDAHHHDHIRKTGTEDQIAYVDRWSGGAEA